MPGGYDTPDLIAIATGVNCTETITRLNQDISAMSLALPTLSQASAQSTATIWGLLQEDEKSVGSANHASSNTTGVDAPTTLEAEQDWLNRLKKFISCNFKLILRIKFLSSPFRYQFILVVVDANGTMVRFFMYLT